MSSGDLKYKLKKYEMEIWMDKTAQFMEKNTNVSWEKYPKTDIKWVNKQ